MAKKPLIFVGIEGAIPNPLPKKGYVVSETCALLPFGTLRRKENDHFKALSLALELMAPNRKVFVTEKTVEFDLNDPSFDWNHVAPTYLEKQTLGSITVSSTIASTFEKLFDFDHQGTFSYLKEAKVSKQRLRGLSASYAQMVGRTKELHELCEILEQSFEDRGQIASIIGDGGLGKTRLWVEFEKYLEHENTLHFFGTFTLQNETPLHAISEVFGQLVDHFEKKLVFTDQERVFLSYFIDGQSDAELIKNLSPQDLEQNIFQLIRTTLDQLAEEKFAIVMDDIHWADEASQRLIEFMVPLIPKRKQMWLLIHRPAYTPSFTRELFYHPIKLKALDVTQIEAQIKNMMDLKYIAPSTLAKIHEHSKGNPFFVEEIFRHSIENKLVDTDNRIIQDIPLDRGIPMNIQSMVQTRLDHLDAKLFEALKILAVLGSEIYREEADALLSELSFDAKEVLQRLTDEAYLSEISVFPENKIGFYHDIIFEAVRDQNLSEKESTQNHETIANFLIKFHHNNLDKHIFRICDHLINTSYQENQKEYFEKAALQASEHNNFYAAKKYYAHLYINKSLEKNLFPTYFTSLNNTKSIEELERFLQYWGNHTKIENEDPGKGYYFLYGKFLLEQRRLEEVEIFCTKTIDQYKKKHSDNILLPLTSIYIQALTLNHRWPIVCNISLKQLRLLNSQKNAIEKIPYLYALSYLISDNSKNEYLMALDFTSKGMDIVKTFNSVPFYEQDLLFNRYALFQTVHRCNYKLSAKIWSMIIQLRKENGFISELDHCYSQLLVNNFLAGDYNETISNYNEIHQLNEQKQTRHFYYVSFWASLTYLILGNDELFIKHILTARKGRQKDPYFRTMRFYCMGYYHLSKNDFYNAYISFKRLHKFYSKLNVNIVVADAMLLMLSAKIQYRNSIDRDDISKAKQAFSTKTSPNSYNHWSFQMLSLTFARYTDEDFGIDPMATDPKACPNALLKQKMYVEKIKFLDFKGMEKEAKALRKEYQAYRDELELSIPSEHIESFRKNSLFPVP
ncbi:MAG: AAA family ATPase [Bdellovibrionales bacterium]|nr:AAA family ATPase [Bdellovibrionales bacterium]